ncbi:MAG: porin family protein [Bryobacteraceae bacterium]|nr:porin family protein [Bryobacteraceae bacterium]
MKSLLQLGAAVALLPLASSSLAYAQKWEIGGGAGGSFYTSQTVSRASLSANAKFDSGWGATGYIGHNMYSRVGGEVRYSFLKNDAKLSSGSDQATFGANAHAIHYDVLIHATKVGSPIRPFVAIGGGIKMFRGTGKEVVAQRLGNLAFLTRTNEVKPVITFGAGVKLNVSKRVGFRVEVKDYFSQFPTDVIAPASGSKLSGNWIHNFVAMASLSLLL